jgi:hypothetical protein
MKGITTVYHGLFDGIHGQPRPSMFRATFQNCSNITSIPTGLFANISGTPADSMYSYTFSGCTGLKTVPSNIFGTFTGALAPQMFDGTFNSCTGLTTIADDIWDLSGVTNMDALYAFSSFVGNTPSLTSPSPRVVAGGKTLWEHFSNYLRATNVFSGAKNLADWNCIPTAWGGGGQTGCE